MHSDSLLRIYLRVKDAATDSRCSLRFGNQKPDGISEAAMETALNVSRYLLKMRRLLLPPTAITAPVFIPLFLSSLHSPLKVNYS